MTFFSGTLVYRELIKRRLKKNHNFGGHRFLGGLARSALFFFSKRGGGGSRHMSLFSRTLMCVKNRAKKSGPALSSVSIFDLKGVSASMKSYRNPF